MLEPGVSYWRAHGSAGSAGLCYEAEMPVGVHISAGRGRVETQIDGQRIAFVGPSFARFTLMEPTRCATAILAGTHWTSLGLWIAPSSDLYPLLSDERTSVPRPCPPPAGILALIGGSWSQRYRGVAHQWALRAEAYALLASSSNGEGQSFRPPAFHRREAVAAARAIIDNEYADPPTLAELARCVGVNRRYLTHDFRERYGRSIAAHIAALRLQHADDMLAAGLPVGEVAARVGLSPSHFAQAYRRRFGHPPSRRM